MKKITIMILLIIIIVVSAMPSNAIAAVSATPELYRSSVFIFNQTCFAIKADNSLWGWGVNGWSLTYNPGQIIAASKKEVYLTPVKVSDDVLTVGVNDLCTFILKTNGDLWGWGSNFKGALAQNTNIEVVRKAIKIMEGVTDIKTYGSGLGSSYTVVLKKDGTLWHWGEKWGDDYWDSYSPSLLLENVAALCNQNYAIKTDGTMWELTPLDRTGTTLRPRKVELTQDAQNAKILYPNAYIKKDGSLWRWGNNKYGEVSEVGAGHSIFTEDVPIENAKKKLDDVVFYNWSLAIKKDGSLWSWGTNQYGAMGKGDDAGEFYTTSGWSAGGEGFKGLPYYTTPVKIMEDVAYCATGGWNGLAVKNDGSLWSWGNSYNGMVGNGSLRTGIEKEALGEEFYPTPQKIMDGVRVTNTTANIPPRKYTATPTSATVLIDGRKVSFEAYGIDGSNYFKLRDLAMALNNGSKNFEVGWDSANSAVMITSKSKYTPAGGELTIQNTTDTRSAIITPSKIYLDGEEVNFEAYRIAGNNYLKLRDIGMALDFGVAWDGVNNTIRIDTNVGYTQ